MRHLASAVAISVTLAIGGCAELQGFVTAAGGDIASAVNYVSQPSTLAAFQAIEAGGAKFICAAASAQAAATAQEKANGVGGSIETDGQLFYFGSSLACSLLGGNVTTAAVPASLAHHAPTRGLRRLYAVRPA